MYSMFFGMVSFHYALISFIMSSPSSAPRQLYKAFLAS